MPRLLALVVIPLALIAATLSGCTATTELPPPEPAREGEPLFATDEEALAAATAAYEEYLAVSNAVTSDSGIDVSEISPLTTPNYFLEVSAAIEDLRNEGLQTSGSTRLHKITLQQWTQTMDGIEVAVYVCLDVSGARLLDMDGMDVTPSDRAELVPLELAFVSLELSRTLLLDSSDSWPQGDVCQP